MSADIVIYALVAAGLVFWLRSILGTRNGTERQRPNPFTTPADPATQRAAIAPGQDKNMPQTAENMAAAVLALPTHGGLTLSNRATVEPVLLSIARIDRGFTLSQFMIGAQDAFVMIVEGFASGDRELLSGLLDAPLYKAFEQAVSRRESEGQSMTTEIHAIRRTEIVDARMQDKMAFITIRFVADETSVIRNKDGSVAEGNPDRVSETIDIWTFGRNIRDRDPTWFLFATREEATGATAIPSV